MLRSKLSSLREYWTPANNKSNFIETGEISPQEFIVTGDYLVHRFPTWQWLLGPKKLHRLFLPPDKQFLVTKHVPSYQRALVVTGDVSDVDAEDMEGEWVAAGAARENASPKDLAHIESIDEDELRDLEDENAEQHSRIDEDIYEDLDPGSELRRYDLYITYLTLYRVPKVYLVGFSASGVPLTPTSMFMDISPDYRDKTATIENLPVAESTTAVLIHPCKHANVMKVLNARSSRRDINPDEEEARVDQYLITFLKFISSVTPCIEYDYTMGA